MVQELGETDSLGQVTIETDVNELYEVSLSASDTAVHHILGVASEQPSTQITFVSDNSLTQQVFSLLDIVQDSTKGLIVIGLDEPNLSPAVGASADLSVGYETAFVLGQTGPIVQKEITPGVGGFVTFANVDIGVVDLSITPPNNQQCKVFSGEPDEQPTISSRAGEITVIAFTCR